MSFSINNFYANNQSSFKKKVIGLIIISAIIKIILSLFLELGNDEVYYYTYAIQPDWNHFDHPGMVGWMIRLTTLNLHWVSTFSLRLGSIIAAVFATYIIYKTGALIKDERAGYFAAWLYTVSIYTTIIAGFFVMPDSPQLLFFTLSIYLMVKLVIQPDQFTTKYWLLLGVFIGFAVLSKVHGMYLWIGFIAFVICHKINVIKNRNLYLSIFITVLIISPIFIWNIQNDFITYRFHSKRVMHTGILVNSFCRQIAGEFIYQNPFIYISIIISLFKSKFLKASFQNQKVLYLLLWLGFPLIFTFWGLSLFNPTLPHWTGPGYIALFLITGVFWSEKFQNANESIPKLLKLALLLLVSFILGFFILIYIFPRQLGSEKLENLGEFNPLNDITGWSDFSKKFSQVVHEDIVNGNMKPNSSIIINKWFPGGHILFYTARPLKMTVHGIGSLDDLHKFAWLNKAQKSLIIGDDAYCIVPSNLPANPNVLYGHFFEKIMKPDTIQIKSRGVLLRNFYVYRLKNCDSIPENIIK